MDHQENKMIKRVQKLCGRSKSTAFGVFIFLICASLFLKPSLMAAEEELAPGREMAKQAVKDKTLWITSDHKQHEALKQKFTSGPQVTKACLSCHNQASLQFHKTIHWTWMDPITEKSAKLGKGGLSINNF